MAVVGFWAGFAWPQAVVSFPVWRSASRTRCREFSRRRVLVATRGYLSCYSYGNAQEVPHAGDRLRSAKGVSGVYGHCSASTHPSSFFYFAHAVTVLLHAFVHVRVFLVVTLGLAGCPRALVGFLHELPDCFQRRPNIIRVTQHIGDFTLGGKALGYGVRSVLLGGNPDVSLGEICNGPR